MKSVFLILDNPVFRLAPRGASGLKFQDKREPEWVNGRLAPRGASGLKSPCILHKWLYNSLAPRGASGLKYIVKMLTEQLDRSSSARS